MMMTGERHFAVVLQLLRKCYLILSPEINFWLPGSQPAFWSIFSGFTKAKNNKKISSMDIILSCHNTLNNNIHYFKRKNVSTTFFQPKNGFFSKKLVFSAKKMPCKDEL